MRLLFLTPQLPYPPQQGTTIRNYNILKHLAPRHEITLLSFGTPEELQSAEPLRALCQRIEIAPYPTRTLGQRAWTTLVSPLPDMALRLASHSMHEIVDAVLREQTFDIIQVEGIEMARYWMLAFQPSQHPISNLQSPTSNLQPPALVFDDHNAEYVLQRTAFESDARDLTRWHAALYSLIQWQKLERYERAVCRLANHIVACSDTDANAIRELLTPSVIARSEATKQSPGDSGIASPPSTARNDTAVAVIPNGVDTDHFVPSTEVCAKPHAEQALVFAGKMDFRPNIDAMTWFCADILPRIRAEIPRAHIVIVGQKPAPRILALKQQPGIEVTGWVPDTRPYIADAAVYVVPLRMGSGTRLKVLEALAMGKAIVSTTRGVEGIELTPDRDAVIADTPEAFARAVVALLHDPERRRALGRAARALAESKYDWRKIVPKFEQVYAVLEGGS
jgi:glycosyltransferase involved in cell wall biosynthesis